MIRENLLFDLEVRWNENILIYFDVVKFILEFISKYFKLKVLKLIDFLVGF